MSTAAWEVGLNLKTGPSIAISVVGVDQSLSFAHDFLEQLRVGLNESLLEEFSKESLSLADCIPMMAVDLSQLPAQLEELTTKADHHDLWRQLELYGTPVKLKRLDTQRLPIGYLVLPDRYLVESAASYELASLLRAAAPKFAGFTIFFVESDKDLSGECQAEDYSKFLEPFRLTPVRTSLVWVTPRLDTGRKLPPDELSLAIVQLLLMDLLHFDVTTERILTSYPASATTTLAGVGARLLRLSPNWAANDKLTTAVELALSNTLRSKEEQHCDLPERLPPNASVVLAQAIELSGNKNLDLRLSKSTSSVKPGQLSDHGVRPVIAGKNISDGGSFNAAVDFHGEGFRLKLDGLPRAEWQEALYEWDFFNHQDTLQNRLKSLDIGFHLQQKQLTQDIEETLDALLNQGLRPGVVAERLDLLADRIDSAYRVAVNPGQTRNFAQSQAALQKALSLIPHLPTLTGRTLLLLLTQAVVFWSVFNGVAPYRFWLLIGVGALAALTAVMSVWSYFAAVRAATEARDQAAADIELRSQLAGCRRLTELLSEFSSSASASVRKRSSQLRDFQGAANKADLPNPPQKLAGDGTIIRWFPTENQLQDTFANFALALNQSSDSLYPEIHRATAASFRQSGGNYHEAGAAAVAAIVKLTRDRLAKHFDSLDFVRLFALDDPESRVRVREDYRWMLESLTSGRYFLPDKLIREFADSAEGRTQYLFLPSSLKSLRPLSESVQFRRSGMKSALMRLFLVQLCEFDPNSVSSRTTSEVTKTSSDSTDAIEDATENSEPDVGEDA